MDLNQARGRLLEKLLDRGMSPEQAAVQVNKFVHEQADGHENNRVYADRWLSWKAERIIEGMEGTK